MNNKIKNQPIHHLTYFEGMDKKLTKLNSFSNKGAKDKSDKRQKVFERRASTIEEAVKNVNTVKNKLNSVTHELTSGKVTCPECEELNSACPKT